jgi:hypothetical protein
MYNLTRSIYFLIIFILDQVYSFGYYRSSQETNITYKSSSSSSTNSSIRSLNHSSSPLSTPYRQYQSNTSKKLYYKSWSTKHIFNFSFNPTQLQLSTQSPCYDYLIETNPQIEHRTKYQIGLFKKCDRTEFRNWEWGMGGVRLNPKLRLDCGCQLKKLFSYVGENPEEINFSENLHIQISQPTSKPSSSMSPTRPLNPVLQTTTSETILKIEKEEQPKTQTLTDLKPKYCQNYKLKKPCYFIKKCHIFKKNINNRCLKSCREVITDYKPGSCNPKYVDFDEEVNQLCSKKNVLNCVDLINK